MIKSDIVDLTEVENMAENVAREIDKEEMLSQELVDAIRELLTKQCIKVMINLYNKRLSNKELAKAMNIASNNLSNTLQRIKSSQLNLLIIEHESRNTYYSLSEIGKKYTEKYLLCDVPKRENVKNTLTQKGIYALNNMKKAWGIHWELKLDEILIACFDKIYSFEIDYCGQEENFKQFINSIERLKLDEQWDELNIIYDLLNPFVVMRIDKSFNYMAGVKYLCILYSTDWEMTFKLIDDFFEKGRCIEMDLIEKFTEYGIESEEVKAALENLEGIIREAKANRMTKDGFYKKWKEYFKPYEQFAFYIATKYEFIDSIENEK